MYIEGAAVTGLGLVALTVLRRFEDKVIDAIESLDEVRRVRVQTHG